MPNLQNITKGELRKCIVSQEGYTFISLDAIQIELKVAAILSQDPLLLSDSRSTDMHLATAIRVFGWTDEKEVMDKRRYDAKQLNFAILYGADEYKVAEMAGCSVSEALGLIQSYFNTYKVLYKWIQTVKAKAKEDGYVINMFGRIRPIPELTAGSWKLREKAERECVNTIVQGTAVDIVKMIMLYLKSILDSQVRLILQVHDEIVWEVPDRLVQQTAEQCQELELAFPDYPCKVSVGKCYGSLEEVTYV